MNENPSRWQFELNSFMQVSTVISVLLGIPLIGRLVLGSMLLGLAILGLLIVLQLPVFLLMKSVLRTQPLIHRDAARSCLSRRILHAVPKDRLPW